MRTSFQTQPRGRTLIVCLWILSTLGTLVAADEISYAARRLLPAAWKASWAPDSKRLVFTRQGGGISVLELASGQVTDLTSGGKDPAWSPDGKFIAYVPGTGVGDNTSAEEVWIISAKGGEPKKIAQGGFPAWTPDGQRVLFHSRQQGKILSVSLNSPGEEPTVFFATPTTYYPAISTDNSRIAFGGQGMLKISDTKTGQLIASMPCGNVGLLPGWSPDGRQVGFGSYSRSPGLWIFDVERGGAYLAATNGTMPAWSPDGKRLVFDVRETGKSWELWVIETASLPRNPVLTNQLPGQSSAESLVGKPAPHFTLPLLDGGDFDLASHQGKHIVLLDFWATWCGPCRAVMPALAGISRDYADKGVKYFAVNLREDSAKIRSYLEGAKLDIAVPLDKDGSIANKYGVRGIPTMVIVGKDGKVKKVHVGSSPDLKGELTRVLDDLLAGKQVNADSPTPAGPPRTVADPPAKKVYSQNIVSYGSPPIPSRPTDTPSYKAGSSDKAAAQIVSEF